MIKQLNWEHESEESLDRIDHDDFIPSGLLLINSCFDWEEISNTQDSVWPHFQAPRNSSKTLLCASYFQLSSGCLDISMKHYLSCLIYDFCFQRSTFPARHVRVWSGSTLLETVRIPQCSCKPSKISSSDLTKSLERAIPSFAKRKKSVNWRIS